MLAPDSGTAHTLGLGLIRQERDLREIDVIRLVAKGHSNKEIVA
jgi:DNA-binding NarL/FixJ family response regulator